MIYFILNDILTLNTTISMGYDTEDVTLISTSPILLFFARIIGLPTKDGNICAGKLLPAYPHLTNLSNQR